MRYCYLLVSIILLACCEESTDTTVSGQLSGAENLSANLDRFVIGGEREMLRQTQIDADGAFTFDFDRPLPTGLYQLRVGAQRVTFALEEGGGALVLAGQLTELNDYNIEATGDAAAVETITTMRRLGGGEIKGMDQLEQSLNELQSDHAAAFVASQALARAGEAGLDLQRAVMQRLPEGDRNRANYAAYLDQLQRQIDFQRAQANIKPGEQAPDISLPGPDGTTYALSDLRGQVVLLDFWAAWCGPCRRENPNVVKVYDRYKDDGFTVFSVSLDGVGDQKAARLTPEQLEEARQHQRQRWQTAIEQDGLSWPYHVSELKHWSGDVTRQYGVRAIPATFLIDREGRIAEVGLRGARSIEQALQKHL